MLSGDSGETTVETSSSFSFGTSETRIELRFGSGTASSTSDELPCAVGTPIGSYGALGAATVESFFADPVAATDGFGASTLHESVPCAAPPIQERVSVSSMLVAGVRKR